jgi:hypothetical protein
MGDLQKICSLLALSGAFGGTDLLNDDGQPVLRNGTRVRILTKKELEKLSKKTNWTPEALLTERYVVPYADCRDRYRVIGGDVAAFLSVKTCLEMFRELWTVNNSALCIAMLQAAYREDDRNLVRLVAQTLSDAETLKVLILLGKRRTASKEKTLYRTDMLDTALLHEWSLKSCQPFLSAVVTEAIGCICRLPLAFEVDTSRALSPLLLAGALQNIKAVCRSIVEALGSTQLPPLLRAFLHQAFLAAKAAGGDPDEVCSTIVVLRVLTPALLDPTKFGLVPIKLHKVQLRGLLLVAKVMQQIANGVAYTEGSVLFALNGFVMEQHKALRDTIVSVSQFDPPELQDSCTGRLPALQKVLAHWPKYEKLVAMNLGLAKLDPTAPTDDPVARFVFRFQPSSTEEGLTVAPPVGMLSAMSTSKKKFSMGKLPPVTRSSTAGVKSPKARGSNRLAVNTFKKKRASAPSGSEAPDGGGSGGLGDDSADATCSEDQGTSEETTFSSELAMQEAEMSTSELDDSSVVLAQAIAIGAKLQNAVMSEIQKAQIRDMLSKIEEVRKALEYANAKL